jgi:NAD(P)-dependent dehydrogenase (short-subunit alcohol dehydrogenase family)
MQINASLPRPHPHFRDAVRLRVHGLFFDCHQGAHDLKNKVALVTVPFFLSRAAMPYLRNSKGVIINIASDWGLVGGRNAVAYCASKGGVVLMSKAMALDHAAEGVRINAVCPGDVETPMLYRSGTAHGLDEKSALREANASNRTGRVTTAAEVAALVAFLASDEAAQITGAAIPIDGGNTAGSAA